MSVAPPPLPDPHLSSSIPYVSVTAVRLDLWKYRLLRSLQSSATNGNFIHTPHYRPFSSLTEGVITPPSLIGADHLFEWRDQRHGYPVVTVLITVNPAFHFTSPHVVSTIHSIYRCPYIHILYWDFPLEIPTTVRLYLQDLDNLFDNGLIDFLYELDSFTLNYFDPVSPYDRPSSPLVPNSPPPLPFIPTSNNPNTIPLVFN